MSITACVVQGSAAAGDPAASRRRYDRLLEGVAADVVLLPELALAGYDPTLDYRALAETEDGATARWAAGWGRRLDALVAVGLPLLRGERILNALLMTVPGGARHTYAKRHPWGGESEQLAPGDDPPPVISFRGLRIAPLICYDMTFPGEAAALAGRAELLLIASAWPYMSRAHADAGRDLARALATQLQAAVAWANQVGPCHTGTRADPTPDRGAGRSLITLPYRAAEVRCPASRPAVATLTIDPARLRKRQREKGL